MKIRLTLGAIAFMAALGLNACEKAQADLPAKAPAETAAANDDAPSGRADPRDAPVREFRGKPLWSANSRYTAEENAAYHFKRNGESFGAKDVDEFVEMAHAFVSKPPKGAETLKRSNNGDLLVYDAKNNIFAVATKDGAPRTMFKPDNGAAYWEEQKEREQARGKSRGERDEAA